MSPVDGARAGRYARSHGLLKDYPDEHSLCIGIDQVSQHRVTSVDHPLLGINVLSSRLSRHHALLDDLKQDDIHAEADMLVELSVANFRSIRERQTLSLVASNRYADLGGNLFNPAATGLPQGELLKGAALYGPNASGKSNILRALWFMARFVATSAVRLPEAPTGVVPFAFDHDCRAAPSELEALFVVDGVLYQYGYAVDAAVVHEEYLYAYPSGRRRRWFHRRRQEGGECTWQTGKTFRLDSAVRAKVRPDNLLLSVGPQFNDERLLPLHRWFAAAVKFIDLGGGGGPPVHHELGPHFTAEMIAAGGDKRQAVLRLLAAADVGVADATVARRRLPVAALPMDQLPTALAEALTRQGAPDALSIRLRHRGEKGRVFDLELDQESAGTQRYFQLIGPWLDTIAAGHVLLVDELETSLHPVLVRELLRLFFSARNDSGAQLIFTTHDPLLLDSGVLRRDQIWFTDRGQDGRTCLYPLSDFKPRNDELLMRGYLSGRYGALPLVERELEQA